MGRFKTHEERQRKIMAKKEAKRAQQRFLKQKTLELNEERKKNELTILAQKTT